ncbi:MAG: hypothetical protein P8179_00120 [Candidatus Thiodiazotropha sp.]|jgi:hypothetical protein
MIEIGSVTALIFVEVMVGLVILSALLVLFTMLRKQRIRKAAQHLAARVQADLPKRTERLKALLEERYQLQGVLLDQTLRNIVQLEKLLYQNVLNGFMSDDELFLQQMDVDVENLVLGYQSLEPAAANDQDLGKTVVSANADEEINELRSENKRLSDELKVTMDTMGRMLNEYSTMFSDGFGEVGNSINPTEPAASSKAMTDSHEKVAVEGPTANQSEIKNQPDSVNEDELTIPEMTEQEITASAFLSNKDTSAAELAGEMLSQAETSENVDEEVSEIIDEVMEMADEMIQNSDPPEREQVGESMVDDLDNLDMEIPEMDEVSAESEAPEAGSLEEEWGKLLEEESSSGESKVDDLDKVDIEIPEMDEVSAESEAPEVGSLEEEWAKLLEEEATEGEPKKET